METNKKNIIYRTTMLVLISVIVTFMITSIGVYNYLTKTDNGSIKTLVKYVEVSDESEAVTAKFEVVKKYLEQYYIGDIKEGDMIETAIKGYVAGLDDEYTEYLTKDEYEELLIAVTGDYVGIGIYMTQDLDGNVIVLMPMEGSPALEADLQIGDIIVKIDDEDCTGMDLNLVSTKIKGEEGTTVKLEILRDGEILTKTVTRKKVEIQDSRAEILEGNIGYIELISFDEKSTDNVKKYLDDFQSKGVKSVIFDFRNNTGGMVTEAISFSELFISRGDTIMRSYDKANEETVITSNNTKPIEMDMVVLVNEYSASATEIVTAALKDNGIATIVGTTTFGKGVMQEIVPVFEGALKITIEEFKTPNGDKIHEKGIEPHKIVEDDLDTEEDEQLNKAIELLK